MGHAKLSPSAAERWMTCPGSVHLVDVHSIVSRGGAAANRGTAIHTLCELALTKDHDCEQYIDTTLEGIRIDAEMAAIGQTYVNFVSTARGDKFYEQRVSVEHIIDDCWGTADCVICSDGRLVIADLKTGFKRVDAIENKQLLIYALGAYQKFDWIYDFSEITLVIVQPTLDHIGTWTISADDLLAFRDELLAAKDRIINQHDLFVMSEKGCEWCPAKFVCPEHIAIAHDAAKVDFADIMAEDSNALTYWLEKLPALKNFISSIEDEAYTRLLSGCTIPNYQLGTAAKRRAWSDEKALLRFVNEHGLQSVFLKEVLVSPSQADKLKLDPKLLEELTKFVEYTEAKAPVVRKQSNPAGSAAADFKSI